MNLIDMKRGLIVYVHGVAGNAPVTITETIREHGILKIKLHCLDFPPVPEGKLYPIVEWTILHDSRMDD